MPVCDRVVGWRKDAVGRYHTTHRGLEPLFCPPNPPPSRNEAIAQFVEWSKDKTQYQGDRAADFVGRFLVEVFACPKDAKPSRRSSK